MKDSVRILLLETNPPCPAWLHAALAETGVEIDILNDTHDPENYLGGSLYQILVIGADALSNPYTERLLANLSKKSATEIPLLFILREEEQKPVESLCTNTAAARLPWQSGTIELLIQMLEYGGFVDQAVLAGLSSDLGAETSVELQQFFVAELDELVQRWAVALRENGFEEMQEVTHVLKNSAALYGAIPLAQTCSVLHDCLASERKPGWLSLCDAQQLCENTLVAYRAQLQNKSASRLESDR